VAANPQDVTDLSDVGTLASGPESHHVVDALGAILDGEGEAARLHLEVGATVTSWATMLHRLDVAGRALALDAGLAPADAGPCALEVAFLAIGAGVRRLPAGIQDALAAWSRGEGLPATVDLATEQIDLVPDDQRALGACLAVAWLVDRAGFPPQVVA